jgi:hypothetical protein
MRRIDAKHHIDGDKLIKTTNGQEIPLNEPTILFRGRDFLALPMLRFYMILCEMNFATDFQLDTMKDMIGEFEKFKTENSKTMKMPGITLGK